MSPIWKNARQYAKCPPYDRFENHFQSNNNIRASNKGISNRKQTFELDAMAFSLLFADLPTLICTEMLACDKSTPED